MSAKLSSTDFLPHLHSIFQMTLAQAQPNATGASPALEVKLTEVTTFGTTAPGAAPQAEGFSLIFCEPNGIHVPQQIYSLTHPELGQLDLFLVPIGPSSQGMQYQAIFT